jgi:hypothetical protein
MTYPEARGTRALGMIGMIRRLLKRVGVRIVSCDRDVTPSSTSMDRRRRTSWSQPGIASSPSGEEQRGLPTIAKAFRGFDRTLTTA